MDDRAYLDSILKKGAQKSFFLARKTLSKVYRKIGFLPKNELPDKIKAI